MNNKRFMVTVGHVLEDGNYRSETFYGVSVCQLEPTGQFLMIERPADGLTMLPAKQIRRVDIQEQTLKTVS